jgi:hypothetical protein
MLASCFDQVRSGSVTFGDHIPPLISASATLFSCCRRSRIVGGGDSPAGLVRRLPGAARRRSGRDRGDDRTRSRARQLCTEHGSERAHAPPPVPTVFGLGALRWKNKHVTQAARKENLWRHQLETTRNFVLPRWISGFFVGLDFQVEHHLFPRMPHQQLRRASPVVRRWCARAGIPYQELGYDAAVIDVTRFMAAAWQHEPREQGDAEPDDDLTPA